MKTQIKKLKSSKLFYNKWPYKVECIQSGASRIIHSGPYAIRNWINSGKSLRFSTWERTTIDKDKLLLFTDAVEPFLNLEEPKIRAEGNHLNLFCKDKTILEEIETKLQPWIIKISGPTTDEEYDFLIANGHKKILCDQLPKEIYQYRIFFKSNWPIERRQSFYTWSQNYHNKIDLSPTSALWIKGDRKYVQDAFMYVKDEQMLSMIGLFLSGYVRKVEEFILRNDVLTV